MSSGPPRKVRKLDNTSNEEHNNQSEEQLQQALEEIDCCQNQIDSLNEKASEEILKIEQKFNKERKPLFDNRNELISNVPGFWVTAFINHPQISELLHDEEEDCLRYLCKLEVEEFEDIKSGYRINFHFSGNPYFKNSVLTKEFHLGSLGDPASQSTQIQWKDGMDLIQKYSAPRHRGRRRHYEYRSFFNWFINHDDPSADDIAEVIKDDLWPNPLQYYIVADAEAENGLPSEETEESVVVVEEEEEEDDDEAGDDDDVAEEEDVEDNSGAEGGDDADDPEEGNGEQSEGA